MKSRSALVLALALLAGAAATAAWAAPAPPQPDYHPSMGDLMTMAVQPRHIKLGLAGQARNWTYAAYEAGELRHAFDRIAKTIPVYRDNDIAGAAANNMKAPLDALDAAIKARDASAYVRAYGKVTQGCNACHKSLEHPEVVVRTPVGSLYPDQDFPAPRRPVIQGVVRLCAEPCGLGIARLHCPGGIGRPSWRRRKNSP